MILVDLNQVMISNLMMQIKFSSDMSEDLIRHMILNSLRLYRTKFGEKYGELVICCDDKDYWRKSIFPYYKAHRKKDREESVLDWNMIFQILNKVRDELKEHFPYKVLQIPHAEADDIIATLCHIKGCYGLASDEAERILILSSDKDFVQLQKYANVEQYSPMQKKFVTCANPARFIQEHIMRGDRGDGVPNFLSKDDVFINNGRQKPLSAKKIEEWNGKDPEEFCNEEMLRNYKRNQTLVDLDYIPQEIGEKIVEEFMNYKLNERGKLLNYFIKKKLKNLMDVIGDF